MFTAGYFTDSMVKTRWAGGVKQASLNIIRLMHRPTDLSLAQSYSVYARIMMFDGQ